MVIALLLSMAICIAGAPKQAYASLTNTRGDSVGTVELSGSDWLGGAGVDIYSNGDSAVNENGDNCVAVQGAPKTASCSAGYALSGTRWQCVEMVNRLYLTQGWVSAHWHGNGNTLKDNLPSGLTYVENGSITNLNSGDVITLDDTKSGHAGIIESYDSTTGLVKIANQNTKAVYSSATLSNGQLSMAAGTWTSYTIQGAIQRSTTSSSGDNTVLRVIKKNQSDGTNLVYWAKGTDAVETWWRPGGDGTHHYPIISISQGDIKDIDAQLNADGQHLLYTATTHDIWETWWYPGQGMHTNRMIPSAGSGTIRRIQKTVASDGAQQLYVLTDQGAYEYWWYPNQTIHGSPIYTLANPKAMKKVVEPDGTQELYVADQGYVYRNWWGGADGLHIGQPMLHISQNDITSLDYSRDSDGKRRIYAGRQQNGVYEASWYSGSEGSPQIWWVTGDNGVRAIRKWMDGNVHVLYVATQGGVFEYWWLPGTTTVHGTTITAQADIHDIDRALTADGAQAVYTAANKKIFETYWWPGGDGLHTKDIE